MMPGVAAHASATVAAAAGRQRCALLAACTRRSDALISSTGVGSPFCYVPAAPTCSRRQAPPCTGEQRRRAADRAWRWAAGCLTCFDPGMERL